jgi:hypothetical protein
MNTQAAALNRKSARSFAEMAKLRGGYPESATTSDLAKFL